MMLHIPQVFPPQHFPHFSLQPLSGASKIPGKPSFCIRMKYLAILYTLLPILPAAPIPRPSATTTAHSKKILLPIFLHSALPPARNPEDNALDFTLDSSGVSPWTDSGRSQILDFWPPWQTCPRGFLKCRRCPHDPRCRIQEQPQEPGSEVGNEDLARGGFVGDWFTSDLF
jgi:hypothetical protein